MPYTSQGIGWKAQATSREAAQAMHEPAHNVRARVRAVLRHADEPLSADEIAERAGLDFMAVRPRLSELRLEGAVYDSGTRRPTRSGRLGIGWRLIKDPAT